ncbi:hypothetical protein N9063_01435, partial [Deltaproteobacteria bacterium]|nr:hypothetical protein [Deltaproteobacteria bacterium]
SAADLTESNTHGDSACYDPDNDGGCDEYSISSIGTTHQRYGQMLLQSAYGPETLDLSVPFSIEYYDGSSFVTHADDTCTAFDFDTTLLSLSNFEGDLAGGDTGVVAAVGVPLVAGGANYSLTAPGPGNSGSADMTYRLDLAGLGWLQVGGSNPTAKATFGIFKGSESLIYLRESVW